MSRKRCLFLLPRTRWAQQLFPDSTMRALEDLVDVTRNPSSEHLTSEELLEYAADVDFIVTGWGTPKIDGRVLAVAPNLAGVFHSAGTVQPIVDREVFDRGVTVTSANHIMSQVTAEAGVAMAMIGNWETKHWLGVMEQGGWKERDTMVPGLHGRILGIVGYGAITRAMLPMLRPFAPQRILIHSRHLDEKEAASRGLVASSLDDLLEQSDIIFLQTSLSDRTYHMIDERRLRLIRADALFVNLGRGELVDEAALVDELSRQRFRAVLDVYTEEPLATDSPLRTMPNVMCLPHLGAATRYCREKMGLSVVESLQAVMDGRRPEGLIDRTAAGLMSLR